MSTEFHTGMIPGRCVWGHPSIPQNKIDQESNQPVLKDGQPVKQWVFGIAFPKSHFDTMIWPYLAAEVATGYPNGAPGKFSYKVKDGDDPSPDSNGVPYNQKPGYAGCRILTVSTEAYAPPVYKFVNGTYVQMKPEEIKCGDYFALKIDAKLNIPQKSTHTPSLYINPIVVEFVAYGDAIASGGRAVDPMQALGGVTGYQLPPGASTAPPVPSAQPGAVAMPGTAPAGIPPVAPMAAPPSPPAGPGLPPPARDFIPGAPPVAPMAAPPSGIPGAPGNMPPAAPIAPPPPPAAPVGPQRPTDPAHIHLAGQPGEMWWINGAWQPAGR